MVYVQVVEFDAITFFHKQLQPTAEQRSCLSVMQVRVVEFNSTTSFHEQLQVIASTGVFISVHTSNLANAQFLPPGAAVFEIIQRNWCWENLDRSFQVPNTSSSYNNNSYTLSSIG